MNITHRLPTAQRQSGAALVIGLILLLVLTVLGVSGLGTASMELRFADNIKQKEYAFQGADSAIRQELVTGPQIVITGNEIIGSPVRAQGNYDYAIDAGGVDTGSVAVTTNTLYRDSLAGTGDEIGSVRHVHFELTADAAAGRGARSRVRQGFWIPAPQP